MIDSLAYRHLSIWARAVLVEIVREFNGYNNGKIGLSQRQLAERLHTTNFGKIGNAIAELMEHGLVDVSTEGKWKQRMAREYRLTFVTSGDRNHLRAATNEYRDWVRDKSSADDVSARRRVSADDVSAGKRTPADDVSAKIAAHRRKTIVSQDLPADDVSPLISKPSHGPATGSSNEHKTPSKDPENTGGDFSASDLTPQGRAFAARVMGR